MDMRRLCSEPNCTVANIGVHSGWLRDWYNLCHPSSSSRNKSRGIWPRRDCDHNDRMRSHPTRLRSSSAHNPSVETLAWLLIKLVRNGERDPEELPQAGAQGV